MLAREFNGEILEERRVITRFLVANSCEGFVFLRGFLRCMLFFHSAVKKPRKLRRKPTKIRQDLGLCAETQKSSAANRRKDQCDNLAAQIWPFGEERGEKDSWVAFNFDLFPSH